MSASIDRRTRAVPARPPVGRVVAAAWVAVAFVAACGGGGSGGTGGSLQSRSRLAALGAAYYSWFPENWNLGTYGQKLDPPIAPLLGDYSSGSVTLAAHSVFARQGGLDFLMFDVWPMPRPGTGGDETLIRARERVLDYYRSGLGLGQVRSAILYEVQGLVDVSGAGILSLDAEGERLLIDDLVTLGREVFGHPSYLRIDDRPVVFLYLTRSFAGDFPGTIARLREAMRGQGLDPYLVGEEVYWYVVGESGRILGEREPNLTRMASFDAVWSYNPLFSDGRFCGAAGVDRFLSDTHDLYVTYRDAARRVGVEFVPTILPGYNDRGVRPDKAFCTVPRERDSGALFLDQAWDRWVRPFIGEAPLVVSTTFNEWNEGSQLEPAIGGPSSDAFLTEGAIVQGNGTRYLDALRT
ncbi:MAG: glycoside hydrolase family 99-like domain-containing protein [bacterium]